MKEGLGLSGWVMRHRRPLVNGVAALEFNAAAQAAVETELESALVCPLSVGDEVIGTIAVYHVEEAATPKITGACSRRSHVRRRPSCRTRSCSSRRATTRCGTR